MTTPFLENKKAVKALAIGIIFLLTAIFYFGYISGKSFVWDDSLYTFYPGASHFATSVAHGSFPLWMPGMRGGIPFYADIQMGTFYPLNWLLVPFGGGERLPIGIYQAFIALHVGLAGLFMFLFLRSLKVDDFAAVAGAVTYAFSGAISLHIIHVSLFEVLVWLPLVLYFINRYLESGKIRHYLCIILATLMTFLVGHPQITVYSAFLVVAYWLYNFVMKQIDEGKSNAGQIVLKTLLELGKIAGVYVATIVTGAAAFFPAFEAWKVSPRQANDYAKIADQSLPFYYLVNLFTGNIFGTNFPTGNTVQYWGFNKDSWDFNRYGQAYWHFWEFGFYAGQFAFFSIVVSLFNLKKFERKNVVVFFLITAAVALWFSLGRYGGLFFILSKIIPGVGMFRTPARMAGITDFALAALSGLLLGEIATKADKIEMKKPMIAGAIFYGAFLLVFLVGGKSIAHELRKPAYFNYAFLQIVFSVLLFALFTGLVYLMRRIKVPNGAKYVSLAIVLLIFIDLFGAYGKQYRGQTNPDQYYSDPNNLVGQFEQFEQQAGPFRFGQLVDFKPRDGVFFPQNIGYIYPHIELIEGMGIFHYGRYVNFLLITNTLAKLDIANVLVFINIDSQTGQGGIGMNTNALPRAMFFDSFQSFPDHESILKAIESGALDYHNTLAVLSSEFDGKLNLFPPSTNRLGAVSIQRTSPESYKITYNVDRPGIIFVSQSDYPGWIAKDAAGKEYEIVSAFSAFQGILIDQPGMGEIELKFDPPVFRKTLPVTIICLILLAGGIAASLLIDKRKEIAAAAEK